MGFIKSAINFLFSPSHSRTATILVLLILFVAVPLTVFVSQNKQSIKQRASGENCEANYTLCTETYNTCNQNCSNLSQSDYDTYDEYTQAYYACTDKCSSDNSACSTDAYNVYLQCLASADSNSTSSVNPTPAVSQEPSPTSEPTPILIPTTISIIESVPTNTPTPTPTPEILFDCSGAKLGYSYQCFSSCQPPYIYSGYNNSGTSCDSYNQTCCVNYNVSTPTLTPTQAPTISIPTAIPSNIPTTAITQNSPTPSPLPYCYLKSKGDGNCDNIINISDYELWRTEFVGMLRGVSIINKPSDFNKDGLIDIVDFNIWKTSFADPSLPH